MWSVTALPGRCDVISASDYRVGDVAPADIIAPFDFAIVNSDQTERLRREELAKVPAVFRFDAWVAVRAEEKLNASFHQTRATFAEAIEVAARKRVLDQSTVDHPSFWRFVEWFRVRFPEFPLSTNLARAWALGEPDEPTLLSLQTALREVMARHIRADSLPEPAETAELRVIPIDNPRDPVTVADVAERSESVARTEVLTVSAARRELAKRLGPEAEELGRFAGQFVAENLVFDEWLTTQKRLERAAELVVFDHYAPGQIIVRAGQLIDLRAKAALDVLASAKKRQQSREVIAEPPPGTLDRWLNHIAAVGTDVKVHGQRHPWLVSLVALLGILAVWRFATHKPVSPPPTGEAYTVAANPARSETILLPAASVSAMMLDSPVEHAGVDPAHSQAQWQLQLREAEHRAEELLSMVRAGLAPHLARELTHKLVQELVCQRATLLRAHQLAEQEIVALEARFERVQRELQDRLASFERRAAELEKELAAKTEQTRELMKATILLTQQKLEEKKAGSEFACN